MLIGWSHKYEANARLFTKCVSRKVDECLHGLLAHWTLCIAHDSMNMHPGDRRWIEENEEADLAKKEETTPIGHSRSSEMTKTPIHIEAEVGFLVGLLLISRFRWVLLICAFGAVYAAAFWGFVGLISVAFIIGRGCYQKGAKSTHSCIVIWKFT